MKSLVLYFSCSGKTFEVAKEIAKKTNGDLFQIEPLIKYTDDDLNWHDKNSRSSIEMMDHSSRPEILKGIDNLNDYDIIYLGFPIWWGVAPTVVNTFLEKHDFNGKTIITFATSDSSKIGKSTLELENSAIGAKFIDGRVIKVDQVDDFLAEFKSN